ncbi:zinc finger and SCAN domain-containing protein 29-like [Eublepharis macularius]|uniref:Zinc finger and SCAN domain-containing protein 29-like n=1 Tax=Eublepharis macularius TaxID=481883 RepID=A0AA97L4J7_EUBMA|nr:zinc finger and SCAN domain-containing protein 29-like [Eublepharis macularius]
MAMQKMAGRGVSWRERETLDLIDFWGEEKVQESLSMCHRNIDVFEKIAEQMAARGHKRTALECRTKTKAMRQEYKRVVAHNSKSGNAPTTCPYYAQLHRIFRGDASIRPQRVARSLSLPRADTPRPVQFEGSEELFSHPMVTLNLQSVDVTANDQGAASDQEQLMEACDGGEVGEEDSDLTQVDEIPEEHEDGSRQNVVAENQPVETAPKTTAQMSPASRLEKARTRSRRVALLSTVAEKMLSQAEREENNNAKERKQTLTESREWRMQFLEAEQRRHEDTMREAQEDRKAFIEAQQQNFEGINRAVSALSSLTEILLGGNRELSHQAMPGQSSGRGSVHRSPQENPPRKRCRVIKPSKKFDL